MMNRIDIGLDQTVALPHHSYLGDYYRDIFSQLRVGPPVYFVFHNKGDSIAQECQLSLSLQLKLILLIRENWC